MLINCIVFVQKYDKHFLEESVKFQLLELNNYTRSQYPITITVIVLFYILQSGFTRILL